MRWMMCAWFACASPRSPEIVIANEALRTAVEALAKHNSVDSAHVGVAAAKSASYAAYEEVARLASPEELRLLLGHASPVVRGYVAKHVIGHGDAMAAEHLLTDTTKVNRMDGCAGGASTLAQLVVDAAENAKAQELLLAATKKASGRDRFRAMALVDPALVREPLQQALANPKTDDLQEAVRIAPKILGAASVIPLASHGDSDVRLVVAKQLAQCPEGLPAIEKLMKDWAPNVRQMAEASYRQHTSARPERVREMFAKSDNKKGVLGDMTRSDNPEVLAFFVEQACAPDLDKYVLEMLGFRREPSEPYLAALDKLANCQYARQRLAVVNALQAMKTGKQTLARLANDSDSVVKAAAEKALADHH